MGELPDPDWFFEHVLCDAVPGRYEPATAGPAAQWSAWWRNLAVDAELQAHAARQGFVLSTAQLTALGVTRSRARARVQRQSWTAPAYGVIAPVDVRTPEIKSPFLVARRRHALRAAAAWLRRPATVISGRSAAILHGLPTLGVPDLAELTTGGEAELGRSSVHAFGAALPAWSVSAWFGVAATDVARTVVDLARHDRRDGLMACDAALRERLASAAQLQQALDDAIGWPGVRQAREIVSLGSPLPESPLESLTRLALHDSGFPAPRLQVEVGDYRVDLLLDARLIIEADGRTKYSGDELWREKRREHALRQAGYDVERVIWADVLKTWPATEQRLRTALRPHRSPSPSAWS